MNAKIVMGMGLALIAAGCASGPKPNIALESARTEVQAAESDPNVNKYAALDLEAAKKQLALADTAALHHQDAANAKPAYLAGRTAGPARARAAAKADDARSGARDARDPAYH